MRLTPVSPGDYNQSFFIKPDMAKPDVKRILRLQIKLVLIAVALSVVLGGARLGVAVSTLLGGLSALIPAWLYSRIAFSKRHVPPAQLMRAQFRAEAFKLLLTALMFGCVMKFYKDLSVAGMFGGYLAAVSGYWFGLLIQ